MAWEYMVPDPVSLDFRSTKGDRVAFQNEWNSIYARRRQAARADFRRAVATAPASELRRRWRELKRLAQEHP